MTLKYNTISFLSDFGVVDETVGVVKSVIKTLAPEAVVLDVSHGVERFDVQAASLMLVRAAPYLVSGVVIAAVGSAKRNIAVEVGDGESVLLAPDNGLLAPVVVMVGGATNVVQLPTVGQATCRDVFAPTASALCNGAKLSELGVAIASEELVPSMLPFADQTANGLEADVLHVDHFGNVLLNATAEQIEALGARLILKKDRLTHPVQVVDAVHQIPSGSLGLIVDASGLSRIVLDQGSAQELLDLQTDASVTLVSSLV